MKQSLKKFLADDLFWLLLLGLFIWSLFSSFTIKEIVYGIPKIFYAFGFAFAVLAVGNIILYAIIFISEETKSGAIKEWPNKLKSLFKR